MAISPVARRRDNAYICANTTSSICGPQMSIDNILSDFEFLDDWEDRYRYVIELGKTLEPLPEDERTDATKVDGCVSQVWLSAHVTNDAGAPKITYFGDSDAHIVRGLIAILFAIYSGKKAEDIAKTDPVAVFDQIGLQEHLTPQRSNGLFSMVERIKSDAKGLLAAA